MTDVFLFDWGDTLMVDFPGVPGKMCDWEIVEVVEGAPEALKFISKKAQIYIATGAAESTENEIKRAFGRVGLDQYITDYFCKSNLGVKKGHPDFLPTILKKLGKVAYQVTMVGDNIEKDIKPAQEAGVRTILLSKEKLSELPVDTRVISSLRELIF